MKTLFIACLIALSATFAGAADKAPDVTHEELTAAIAAKSAVVIDVNGSDSYKQGHIPGAIDFESSQKELAAKLPKDKNTLIIAYCGGPQCNAYAQAVDAAKALGYTNVKHYSKGLKGFKDAGGKLEAAEAKDGKLGNAL